MPFDDGTLLPPKLAIRTSPRVSVHVTTNACIGDVFIRPDFVNKIYVVIEIEEYTSYLSSSVKRSVKKMLRIDKSKLAGETVFISTILTPTTASLLHDYDPIRCKVDYDGLSPIGKLKAANYAECFSFWINNHAANYGVNLSDYEDYCSFIPYFGPHFSFDQCIYIGS